MILEMTNTLETCEPLCDCTIATPTHSEISNSLAINYEINNA